MISKVSGPILVTAAMIRDGDRVLIARRKHDSKLEAGKWEFPGGKVEGGEHPEACLVREVQEELGCEIAVERFFDMASHVYPRSNGEGTHIVLLAYIARLESGKPQAIDADEIRWCSRDELKTYDWAAADIPLYKKLEREW